MQLTTIFLAALSAVSVTASPSWMGGDQVTIKGYHARDATQNVGAARELVTADGRAFAVGPTFSPAR